MTCSYSSRIPVALLGVVLLSAARVAAQTAQADWYPAHILPVANQAAGVLVADFNSDSIPDLLSVPAGDQIAIALGIGHGAFATPTIIDGMIPPVSIVDVDHDGKLDLVATSGFNVRVALGDGHGAFATPIDSSFSHLAKRVVVGDCDGDSIPDAIGSRMFGGAETFMFVKGAGNGTFVAPTPIFAGGLTADEFALADIDHDGKLDLVATLHDATLATQLAVLINQGGGNFASPAFVSVPAHTLARLEIGDVTGDGRADVLLISSDPQAPQPNGAVWLLSGTSSGTLASPSLLANTNSPSDFHASDFDGDGHLDVLFSTSGNQSPAPEFVALRSLGGGAFAPAIRTPTVLDVMRFAIADWSGDGKPDLAFVPSYASGTPIGFLRGRGNGSFDGPIGLPTRAYVTSLAVADVAGSSLDDLIFSDFWQKSVDVQENLGIQGFAAPVAYRVPGHPSHLELGDLTGDGKLDVAVMSSTASGEFVMSSLVATAGGFVASNRSFKTSPPDSTQFVLVDVDGDHALDVVVPHTGSIEIAKGRGDGTFAPPSSLAIPALPYTIAAGDLDGDGDADLVMASSNQYLVLVAWNDGHGGFSNTTTLSTAAQGALKLVDIDGDGDLDILTMTPDGPAVLRNDGANGFTLIAATTIKYVGPDSQWVVLDVDGDHALDIAFNLYAEAFVMRGHGDGTFEAPKRFAIGRSPRGLATGDFDGNGRPDLVTFSGNYEPAISMLLHR